MNERGYWSDDAVDRMRQALEFYADPNLYNPEYGEPADSYPIIRDSGARALAALNPNGLPDPHKQGWYVVNWGTFSEASPEQAFEYGPDTYAGAESYRVRSAHRAHLLTHWGNAL